MAHYDYDKDFLVGKQAEEEVKALLHAKHKGVIDTSVEPNMCDRSKFDFAVRTRKFMDVRIEVKYDIRSWETGNVLVESGSYDRPTGIDVTTADYWVYKLRDGFWVIPPGRLRAMVKAEWGEPRGGGDGGCNLKSRIFSLLTFCGECYFRLDDIPDKSLELPPERREFIPLKQKHEPSKPAPVAR